MSQSRVDVLKVFESIHLVYYNTSDHNEGSQFDDYLPTNMAEMKMMIDTRPRYPADKITFSIAKIAKGKIIRYFFINIDSDATFDVDVSLEDSKRNFLNSFFPFSLF